MSRSLLQVDRSAASSAPVYGPGLRVSQPADAHEHEADKIADTVVRGGNVPRWQFSPTQGASVQRDPTTDPPKPMSTGDMAGKVAEAVLATDAGKKAVKAIKGDPVVKAAKDFITTPAGIAIVGTTAVGTLSALAATKTPLPLQPPKIPLDMVVPGLAVKIEYKGPVNHPTSGMLTFSFTPGGGKKEKSKSESDSIASDIAQLRAEQAQMQAMMHPETLDTNSKLPGPRVVQPASDDKKAEEPPVQRKAESSAPVMANPQSVAAVTESGGRPLDTATRLTMERRMGFDFSKVRVHDDARAADSARELHANAYTTGTSIVFNAGQYSPSSAEGRRLLAHELAHVVQQGGNSGLVQRKFMEDPSKSMDRLNPKNLLNPPVSASQAPVLQDLLQLIPTATWPEIRKRQYPKESAAAAPHEQARLEGKEPDLTGVGSLPNLHLVASEIRDIQGRWATDSSTTADTRVGWLGKVADDTLTAASVPKLLHTVKEDMESRGAFVPKEWKFKVKKGMVEQPTLSADAAGDLANTTAHECRHAQQTFSAARYAAGIQHLDAAKISDTLNMESTIASVAVAKKMDKSTPAAEKDLGARMLESKGTNLKPNSAISNQVDVEIKKLDRARGAAEAARDGLMFGFPPVSEDEAVKRRDALKAEVDAVVKSYSDYRAIPHEADAHDVGNEEEMAFKAGKP
jgi:hypothetical protein